MWQLFHRGDFRQGFGIVPKRPPHLYSRIGQPRCHQKHIGFAYCAVGCTTDVFSVPLAVFLAVSQSTGMSGFWTSIRLLFVSLILGDVFTDAKYTTGMTHNAATVPSSRVAVFFCASDSCLNDSVMHSLRHAKTPCILLHGYLIVWQVTRKCGKDGWDGSNWHHGTDVSPLQIAW